MAEMTFEIEIITPHGSFFSGAVSSLQLPGVVGQMGILPGHAPLLAMLEPGVTTYVQGKTISKIVTGSGFVQVLDNRATVLVEIAENPGEISKGDNELRDLAPDTREARLLAKARQKLSEISKE